ncbi:hypothetical protein CYMTET_18442 [Cymbomonas tetramitiformis]|uniref:Uncharacterized protein n=1 Tax=Cymbomonas tetramitiformis TaxID=36881 RepID=A0AAE0G8N8_9CHLO|nr:hypothetical protein CYMTET_18442 [Cymbomonas tetramitiformis]
MAARPSESVEDVQQEAENLRAAEGQGVDVAEAQYAEKPSGAANLIGAGKRVIRLLEGAVGTGGTGGEGAGVE